MTALDIQRVLMVTRYRRNTVMPRFTPRRWFECDLVEITPAGFWREYEIKVTRADFRADRLKGPDLRTVVIRRSMGKTLETQPKWERLAQSDPSGPNAFWFVAPEGVIPRDELPPWAGLIEMRPHVSRYKWQSGTAWGQITEVLTVEAPKLHSEKADPKVSEKIREACYYRFLTRELHASRCEVEADFVI